MKIPDWGAILRTVQKMAEDLKFNTPPPPPAASADLADVLDHVNAQLPAIITALRAHQGVLTAADDLLALLNKAGIPYAGDLDAAVLAVPGAASNSQKWLPTILWALTAFQPAAAGIQGDDHHVGRG